MILTSYTPAGEVAYTSVAYGYFCGSFAVRMILVDPDAQALVLRDEYDARAESLNARVLSYANVTFDGWIRKDAEACAPLEAEVREAGVALELAQFFGYPDVWANQALLRRLLCGEAVPLAEAGVVAREANDIPEWQEIRSQEEVELFQGIFGFHDTTVDRIAYDETEDGERGIYTCRCSLIIGMTCWLGCRMEFCFEEPSEVHICGWQPMVYSRELYEASLLVEEGLVLWAEDGVSGFDDPNLKDRTFIRAKSVKFRLVD